MAIKITNTQTARFLSEQKIIEARKKTITANANKKAMR
jgi:hypothetical protein